MENSSSLPTKKHLSYRLGYILLLPVWTYAAFIFAQLLIETLLMVLVSAGVPINAVQPVLLTTIISAVVYAVAIALAIGVPVVVWRRKTTAKELGITGWPSWMDLLVTPLALIVYMVLSAIAVGLATNFLPIDLEQAQQLPFDQQMLTQQWQLLLAFITLVVLAPVGEELLFRGYLYGKLRIVSSIWISILVASLAFGLAHLWGGPGSPLQWAVAVDTFVLSLAMCAVREYTGAIWACIFMHMAKNGLAFYLLFINPDIINQLKTAIVPFL